jgi:hypothetical protein
LLKGRRECDGHFLCRAHYVARKAGDFRRSAIDAREIVDLNFCVLRRFTEAIRNIDQTIDLALNRRGARS